MNIYFVDFGFGPWSPWSECSQTCEGMQVRERTCFDFCVGEKYEARNCSETQCPG